MNKKRCLNCGCKFSPKKHIVNQKYCAKKICQAARRRKWEQLKRKYNKTYRIHRKEMHNKWKIKNPRYWERYKKSFTKETKPSKEQSHKIKILIKKGILAKLSKMEEINCRCRVVLTP